MFRVPSQQTTEVERAYGTANWRAAVRSRFLHLIFGKLDCAVVEIHVLRLRTCWCSGKVRTVARQSPEISDSPRSRLPRLSVTSRHWGSWEDWDDSVGGRLFNRGSTASWS